MMMMMTRVRVCLRVCNNEGDDDDDINNADITLSSSLCGQA